MKNNRELEERIVAGGRKKNEKKGENVVLASCIEFFSGVFVTTAFGYFFDYLFSTGIIFTVIFLVLGFVVGFVNIYRFVGKK